jgi:hypothetical protein
MFVASRRRAGWRRMHPIAGAFLVSSWLSITAVVPAQAQVTDQTTANTNEAIPAPSPSIFPSPTATSQTCMFGCSSQSQACQNTCIPTSAGTTVIPSITVVGTTTSPQTCQSNCSIQLQTCQRNCNLGP